MSSFVVGVDGGGTRTEAVALAFDGQLLGRARGRAALLDVSNAESVARAVHHAAQAAAAEAGLTLPAAALFAGIAGAGRPGVRDALRTALAGLRLGDRVELGTDVEAAAADALEDGPGIVLLAGTGSIAWGRSPDGREMRVGGWGRLLGDEGSGYATGLEALRAVARAADGRGPATALTGRVLEATGAAEPKDLIPWVQGTAKSEVAALAPIVIDLAATDATARDILQGAAEHLAQLAVVLARRLGTGGQDAGTVALAGGLLGAGILRDQVRDRLAGSGLAVSDRRVDGALGAGRLALRLAQG